MNDIHLKRLTSADSSDHTELWPLYIQAFPGHERRSLKAHCQALLHPDYYCMAIFHENHRIGLAWYWKNAEYTYLEHFTIFPECRNRGYGKTVLNLLIQQHSDLILEVDPPTNAIRRRRIAFYKRQKLYLNYYPYFHRGYGITPKPHHLMLMTSHHTWPLNQLSKFYQYNFQEIMAIHD